MGRVSDIAMDQQQEGVDELLCEIDHWKERAERGEALLANMIDALDNESLQMDSVEIDDSSEYPPHPWHEEWLSYVRTFLEKTKP